MILRRVIAVLLIAGFAIIWGSAARAGQVNVAVAANFTVPAKQIAAAFEKAHGHKVVLSFGATGQFYAQITQGAPFDVLLAADSTTPAKAVAEGFGVEHSAFTFAVGRLVLYSRSAGLVDGEATLKAGRFAKIAIANPATAPYGAAAVEAMKSLGVEAALRDRIVQGNNIGQTFQFVASGNAEIGFVASSQVALHDEGSRWVVPERLHQPIAQDAVLLAHGRSNPTARAFMAFLKGPEARAVIVRFGYGLAD